jgi:hypothetical protein
MCDILLCIFSLRKRFYKARKRRAGMAGMKHNTLGRGMHSLHHFNPTLASRNWF